MSDLVQGPEAARAALRAWLDIKGETISWLAGQLGVAQPTASRWLSNSRPDEHLRDGIAILSKGLVPAPLWRTHEEVELLRKLRQLAPCAATPEA